MTELTVERRYQENGTAQLGPAVIAPLVDEMYWRYRVQLTDEQALLGFPKFSTIGIGFAKEEDWNSNLPHGCTAEKIASHIEHNAGDPAITHDLIVEGIELIQAAILEDEPERQASVDRMRRDKEKG